MSSVAPPLFALENTFARDLPELALPWQATPASAPELLALNGGLAEALGLDPAVLASDDGVAVLAGNAVLDGTTPVAQAYAGHQFGNYSPRLGDGRALLLGELIDPTGRRFDLHLKGSGRTPFARGGDGLAAVGPMLRELVISEAMHAMGVPTTRALAVVATGDRVHRETTLPGAVLVRVASSHLRVGSFQFAARHEDPELVRRLADHAIARHYPLLVDMDVDDRYLAFFAAVVEVQAALVAQWMGVGFIHGVMNTDNMTISGETIDYGPCAFLDTYDPATVFSSIDHAGRYAFGNQPSMAQWNLARLAEPLLPLIDADQETAVERATAVLSDFPHRFRRHWETVMRGKLGVPEGDPDETLAVDLLSLMGSARADYTGTFRSLSAALRGNESALRERFEDQSALDAWLERWRSAVKAGDETDAQVADAIDAVNPVYIPRNHLVEESLMAATAGNLEPFSRLLDAVRDPFTERESLAGYESPAPAEFAEGFRTFCGT